MALAGVGKRLEISDEDRVELKRIVRAASSEVRIVERARIVLCAAEGYPAAVIAERVGCGEKTAKKWRGRYARAGIEGLHDAPRPGPPLTHGPEVRALLIAKACTRPPETPEGARQERWTYEQLGAAVGMSGSQAHAILARGDQAAPDRLLDHERLLPARRGALLRGLRPVRRPAGERAGRLDRREDGHPGQGADQGRRAARPRPARTA